MVGVQNMDNTKPLCGFYLTMDIVEGGNWIMVILAHHSTKLVLFVGFQINNVTKIMDGVIFPGT